ncbi:PorT family protein [Flavobacteriaceae bacterium]|nr:PorT family protein [Flavobacteriaceae bacterium]
MKHVLSIFFILCSIQFTSAQLFSKERVINNENFDKARLSYGYYLGFNVYDYNFDYHTDIKDIQVLKSTGFNVGLVGNVRINDYIDIRLEPGLVISRRELNYSQTYFTAIAFEEKDLIREIQSTFIHVPLLVKFSSKRINNVKPFVVVGISTALNLSSQQDNPDDNSKEVFRVTKNNLYYELGIGVDLYLTWFKFTPSIRGVFSMQDELIKDIDPNSRWTRNITQMQTRGVFINFTFQ